MRATPSLPVPRTCKKLYAEEMALAYGPDFPINIHIARFHNIYGPHQPGIEGEGENNSKELQDSTPRVEQIWYATIQSSRAIAPICNIKLHRSPKLPKLIESSKDGK